jgi:hypothetical protein
MPARLVPQVLDVWRDIERLLDSLPPDHPQRLRVMEQLDELARTYRSVTTTADDAAAVLSTSRGTIEASRALLRAVRSGRA